LLYNQITGAFTVSIKPISYFVD